jgi:hypothetical protein
LGGGQQPVAEPGRAEAAATGGEQEVGERPGPRVWDRPVRSSLRGPLVECGQRGSVEGDHAFGGELAERDPQPGPGHAVADDAADFQVEELTDAQARAAQDGQADAGEDVVQADDGAHDGGIGVGWQGRGQRLAELGDVSGEHQPAGRCFGPAPGGDVVEHVAHGEHRGLGHRHGDGAAFPAAAR